MRKTRVVGVIFLILLSLFVSRVRGTPCIMEVPFGVTCFAETVSESYTDDSQLYTDTDRRRGTLAIRCDVFQGFHGSVTVHLYCEDTGKEIYETLTLEEHYASNIDAFPGCYKLMTLETQTDGREFVYVCESDEVFVEENKTSIFRIHISPESIIRFPDEIQREDMIILEPVLSSVSYETEESPNTASYSDEHMDEQVNRKEGLERMMTVSAIVIGILSLLWSIVIKNYLIDQR